TPPPAESDSCGAVDEARVSVAERELLTVEVPIASEEVVAESHWYGWVKGSEPAVPVAHVVLYIRPVTLVLRQPAVVVASVIAPVVPLMVRAEVVVVESPETLV